MWGWMKHKLESRLLGEISITSDMQMTPPLWQKAKRATKDEMASLDGITDLMDMSLSKLQVILEDRGAWWATIHGATKSETGPRD